MNEIKRVLICGIGAVGSIYANKINEYNSDLLRILVDKNRYEKYLKSPKIFNGKELKLNYIMPEDKSYHADLIIIATKFGGLSEVIENIKNFVGSDTIIISLINGVTSEEIIAQKYGWGHTLLAYFIGHSAMRNDNIISHDGIGKIVFGLKNESVTNSNDITLVSNFFDKVGIDYENPSDMPRALWLKYLLNTSSNQASAILKMTFGQMQQSEKYMYFMKNAMDEVIQIAKACGINNTETMLEDALKGFAMMSPDGKTSMLQDVEAKRKTELDIFANTVIELGEKYNISTPYNKIMKEMIEVIEENY